MRLSVHNTDVFVSTGGRNFDPSGNVLLFIHGSGQSHLTFLQQGRFFANRGWQILNPDMPAHGHSKGGPLSTIDEMAKWYHALLQQLDIAKVTVIGHSQGCLVGLEIARQFPELVEKLCLIAGAMAIPVNDDLLSLADKKPDVAYQAMVNWAHGNDSHLYDHSWPGLTHIDMGHKVMATNDDSALLADLTACNNYAKGAEAAAAVTCPTLALLAEKDKMTPAKMGAKMADTISNCQTNLIKEAGHFLPSERPFEVNQALRSFLQ